MSFESVLESPFVYIPHDVVIPGAIPAGDLPDVAAALQVQGHFDQMVDGDNQLASAESVYPSGNAHLSFSDIKMNAADWLVSVLVDD